MQRASGWACSGIAFAPWITLIFGQVRSSHEEAGTQSAAAKENACQFRHDVSYWLRRSRVVLSEGLRVAGGD